MLLDRASEEVSPVMGFVAAELLLIEHLAFDQN